MGQIQRQSRKLAQTNQHHLNAIINYIMEPLVKARGLIPNLHFASGRISPSFLMKTLAKPEFTSLFKANIHFLQISGSHIVFEHSGP